MIGIFLPLSTSGHRVLETAFDAKSIDSYDPFMDFPVNGSEMEKRKFVSSLLWIEKKEPGSADVALNYYLPVAPGNHAAVSCYGFLSRSFQKFDALAQIHLENGIFDINQRGYNILKNWQPVKKPHPLAADLDSENNILDLSL